MPKYDCDKPELKKTLQTLEKQVEKGGGWFSDHLIVYSRSGNLSLRSDLPSDKNDLLLSVPEGCFIPLENAKLGLKGDEIVIKSVPKSLSDLQVALLETMVKIYNLTEKISNYRKFTPRYVFRKDPEMLDRLVAGREGAGIEKKFREFEKAEDPENLLLEYFIRTRNLRFNTDADQLIPFIDFTNHHILAKYYDKKKGANNELIAGLRNNQAVPNSNEIFVRYGNFDAYDTYLTFGFSVEPITYIQSVPAEIRLENTGYIKVHSTKMSRPVKNIAPQNRDIAFFLPKILNSRTNFREVSKLVFPSPNAPLALKRVLALLIDGLKPDLNEGERERLVLDAEKQLIDQNRKFYKDLATYLTRRLKDYKGNPAFEMAREMCTIQLNGLQRYEHL